MDRPSPENKQQTNACFFTVYIGSLMYVLGVVISVETRSIRNIPICYVMLKSFCNFPLNENEHLNPRPLPFRLIYNMLRFRLSLWGL